MRKSLFAALALVAFAAAAPASAADISLPGLGTIGVIGGVGLVGGTSGSDAYSGGQATGWKSPSLNDGNSTISGKYDSYGLAESSIRGDVTKGYNGTGENGFGASLNVGSGALAASSGSLTAPGSLSSSSGSWGNASTGTFGGGAAVGLK